MGEHPGLAQHFTFIMRSSFLSRVSILSRAMRTNHLIELKARGNDRR